jgi:hypothetical protein
MPTPTTAAQNDRGEPPDEFVSPATAVGTTGRYRSDEVAGVLQSWLRAAIPVAGRSYKPKMRTPNK